MSEAELLKDFIINKFLKERPREINSDTPLVTSGLIDSFGLVEVSAFVEDTFKVRIAPEDLNVDNMDTLGQILLIVDKSRKGKGE